MCRLKWGRELDEQLRASKWTLWTFTIIAGRTMCNEQNIQTPKSLHFKDFRKQTDPVNVWVNGCGQFRTKNSLQKFIARGFPSSNLVEAPWRVCCDGQWRVAWTLSTNNNRHEEFSKHWPAKSNSLNENCRKSANFIVLWSSGNDRGKMIAPSATSMVAYKLYHRATSSQWIAQLLGVTTSKTSLTKGYSSSNRF